MIGVKLGHIQIIEKIGEGGMGAVYRSHDENLRRDVAVKVLPRDALTDASARRRFRKEALALSRLNHPNIEIIYDFDTHEGMDYLVMEYIPGHTLKGLLLNGPMPEKEILRLGTQIGEGLAAAHERHTADGTPVPIVHRDVSPQNLLLGIGGAVKLSDFGLARARDRTRVLTIPGFIKGKLGYLAPELVGGQEASPQSDVFAMGSVLWEALVGHPLFTGKNDREVLRAIHRGQVAPVNDERPGLPKLLVFAIARSLGRTPVERYPSAAAMAQDLEGALAGALMSTLEIQLRLGRAVNEARRYLTRRPRNPDTRSTLRMQVRRSRLDLTRRDRGGRG